MTAYLLTQCVLLLFDRVVPVQPTPPGYAPHRPTETT
jgi:hypothetical protein